MNRHLLVPLDGNPESETVLSEVQRCSGLRDDVHFLHVVPILHSAPGDEAAQGIQLHQQAADYLKVTRDRRLPNQRGLDLVRAGKPAEEIVKAALELNIHLIAMTSHGRKGFGRLLMGSVASEVIRKSQLPVLLSRPGMGASRGSYARILMALEGHESPEALLETLRSLGAHAPTEIILFHAVLPVADPVPAWALPGPLSLRSTPLARLQHLADTLEQEGYAAWPLVSTGNPVEEILEQSRHLDVDLVTLSTQGRNGWERLLEGSIAEAVLLRSPVAVLLQKPLVVRHPALAGGPHA